MQRWGRIPGRRTCRRNQSRDEERRGEERRGECLASIRDHWIQHLDVGGSALVLGDRFSISPRQSSKTLAVGDGTRPIVSALELISGQRESTGSRSGTGSAGSSASARADSGGMRDTVRTNISICLRTRLHERAVRLFGELQSLLGSHLSSFIAGIVSFHAHNSLPTGSVRRVPLL